MLYICSLENSPADYQLYRYDYATSESTFICAISSQREPQFFALDNDYSPGFFVDKADKEAYAFLGERNEIVTFDGEDTPYYACEWGYATSLRNQWNNYEFDHNTKKEENNIFRFYDGTTVPIKNGGRTISAGENKVLFLISSADNRLAQFDKKTGKTEVFEGNYDLRDIYPDRFSISTNHMIKSPFLWRHDYSTKTVTITSTDKGEFKENNFSYAPDMYTGVDLCWWLVGSQTFLAMAYHDFLKIDLELGTIEPIPRYTSKIDGAIYFDPFDQIIYKDSQYEIVERYLPSLSGNHQTAYYVRKGGSSELTLLQPYSRARLYYQKVVVKDE